MKTGSESHETESRDGKYSYRDIQNTQSKLKIDLGDNRTQQWTLAQDKLVFEAMYKSYEDADGWIVYHGIGFESRLAQGTWRLCGLK